MLCKRERREGEGEREGKRERERERERRESRREGTYVVDMQTLLT